MNKFFEKEKQFFPSHLYTEKSTKKGEAFDFLEILSGKEKSSKKKSLFRNVIVENIQNEPMIKTVNTANSEKENTSAIQQKFYNGEQIGYNNNFILKDLPKEGTLGMGIKYLYNKETGDIELYTELDNGSFYTRRATFSKNFELEKPLEPVPYYILTYYNQQLKESQYLNYIYSDQVDYKARTYIEPQTTAQNYKGYQDHFENGVSINNLLQYNKPDNMGGAAINFNSKVNESNKYGIDNGLVYDNSGGITTFLTHFNFRLNQGFFKYFYLDFDSYYDNSSSCVDTTNRQADLWLNRDLMVFDPDNKKIKSAGYDFKLERFGSEQEATLTFTHNGPLDGLFSRQNNYFFDNNFNEKGLLSLCKHCPATKDIVGILPASWTLNSTLTSIFSNGTFLLLKVAGNGLTITVNNSTTNAFIDNKSFSNIHYLLVRPDNLNFFKELKLSEFTLTGNFRDDLSSFIGISFDDEKNEYVFHYFNNLAGGTIFHPRPHYAFNSIPASQIKTITSTNNVKAVYYFTKKHPLKINIKAYKKTDGLGEGLLINQLTIGNDKENSRFPIFKYPILLSSSIGESFEKMEKYAELFSPIELLSCGKTEWFQTSDKIDFLNGKIYKRVQFKNCYNFYQSKYQIPNDHLYYSEVFSKICDLKDIGFSSNDFNKLNESIWCTGCYGDYILVSVKEYEKLKINKQRELNYMTVKINSWGVYIYLLPKKNDFVDNYAEIQSDTVGAGAGPSNKKSVLTIYYPAKEQVIDLNTEEYKYFEQYNYKNKHAFEKIKKENYVYAWLAPDHCPECTWQYYTEVPLTKEV